MIQSIAPAETTSVFLILLVWLVVLGVLYLLRQAQDSAWLPESRKEKLRGLLPLLELTAVLTTLVWSGWQLPGTYSTFFIYLVVVIAALLLWTVRFALFDVIAGIVLKAENLYKTGDTVIFDTVSSTIEKVGFRCLTVIQPDGKYVKIPYHCLATIPLIKPTASDITRSHSFRLSLPAGIEMTETLKAVALNTPWSVPTMMPGVELIDTGAELSTYQITVFTLDSCYFPKLEQSIRHHVATIDFGNV